VQHGLWDVVLNATNVCEPKRKLCDMKTLRLTNDLWRNTFRQANLHRSFTEPKNTCYVHYAPLSLTRTFRIRDSGDSLPSNRRIFCSGNKLIFNCEVIKTERSDRWTPLGLALLTLWSSLAHSLQQKYSFPTHYKNIKARCKNYFLVVKITISIYVSRKLLRTKSTTN